MVKKSKKQSKYNGVWTRCMFVVPKKNGRYCNGQRKLHSEYCGTHDLELNTKDRVKCPVDPSHMVSERDLEKHLKVCTRAKEILALEQSLYYCKDYNSSKSSKMLEETKNVLNKELLEKIYSVYEKFVKDIPSSVLFHAGMEQMLMEKRISKSTDKKIVRHIRQQASIVANMESVGLLKAVDTFVEFGAGKGSLSEALVSCASSKSMYLVDRGRNRYKSDRNIADQAKCCERMIIDIRHLKLDGALKDPFVGISKHLCGSATDLTIKCIEKEFIQKDSKCPSKGLALALCCHHVCNWHDFCNPHFFIHEMGFKATDFDVLTKHSSWAVSGAKDDDTYSAMEKKDIGRKCKRIIDYCRLEYLKNYFENVQLVSYCDIADSPENCLLLATRINSK